MVASKGISFGIGKKAIVRTYSAGVWFGTIKEKVGNEVVMTKARRMWKWRAAGGICLSSCAMDGIDASRSKISLAVDSVWLEAIEIIPCAKGAIKTIEDAPHATPQ